MSQRQKCRRRVANIDDEMTTSREDDVDDDDEADADGRRGRRADERDDEADEEKSRRVDDVDMTRCQKDNAVSKCAKEVRGK